MSVRDMLWGFIHIHTINPNSRNGKETETASRSTRRARKNRQSSRDIRRYQDHFGHPRLFTIAGLEPDHHVLAANSESGCPCDSSYRASNYYVFQKMRLVVDFHLHDLELCQMLKRDRSVVLVHPISPWTRTNPDVYDEHRLAQIVESSPEQCRLRRLDHL